MNIIDIIIFFIPLITGYCTALICPMKKEEAGASVPARPPGWVFGVVWPILYLLTGLAWVQLRKQKNKNKTVVDILFSLLIIVLNSWLIVYNCLKQKKNAVYILVISVAVALATWGYSVGTTQMFYLTPLVVWLMFATMLNFAEVNNKS